MKEIELTQNKYAWVDDEDFDEINRYKWSYHSRGYAVRTYKRKAILMHRQIMNAPDGVDVDHINRDKLDNGRTNLRLCSRSDNRYNTGIQQNNKSGYRCIHWDKQRNKWFVQVKILGKNVHVGRYKLLTDAIRARDEYELTHRRKVVI